MRQVTSGHRALMVSRLAFGTWAPGGDLGPTDTAAAIVGTRHPTRSSKPWRGRISTSMTR